MGNIQGFLMDRKQLIKIPAYLGLDPGLKGAVSLVSEEGDLFDVFDFPIIAKSSGKGNQLDASKLLQLFGTISGTYEIKFGMMEQVGAMPRQGVTSMFSFGKAAGMLEMALAYNNIPYIMTTPAIWKKSFSLLNKDKDAARDLVCKMFPDHRHFFSRKKDIDRADATLMALYSWKYKKGK